MIRGRGYRTYKPPQLLTGNIDDFPLVPETPVDIVERPILPPPPSRSDEGLPVSTASRAWEINRDPERTSGAEGRLSSVLTAAPPSGGLDAGEPTPQPPDNKTVIESLEPAKELAVTAPPIANETPRILESEEHPVLAALPVAVEAPPPEPSPRRTRKRARRKSRRNSPPLSSLEMHRAHCSICDSEIQEEIDEHFTNWHSVRELADEYDIDRRAIYRHAHATGLFPIRDRHLRRALGLLIEDAEIVEVSADSVIRAVRTMAHLNSEGEWVNPPTHVVFSSGSILEAKSANLAPSEPLQLTDTRAEQIKP
jgi:hypothetical protein